MEALLNFVTGLSLVLFLIVLFSVRRAHIRVEYSVSWLGAAAALLVLSRSHKLLNGLAARLDLSYPPVALLLVVGCIFILVLFRHSVVISALKDANIALAQRVAILEFHLHSLDEEKAKRS